MGVVFRAARWGRLQTKYFCQKIYEKNIKVKNIFKKCWFNPHPFLMPIRIILLITRLRSCYCSISAKALGPMLLAGPRLK